MSKTSRHKNRGTNCDLLNGVGLSTDIYYHPRSLLHRGESTQSFLAALQDYEPLLEKDDATWNALIEAHPDQFLWGTDRPAWNLDREVGQALANYGQAFISRLDPAVSEKFAYQNAERLFE